MTLRMLGRYKVYPIAPRMEARLTDEYRLREVLWFPRRLARKGARFEGTSNKATSLSRDVALSIQWAVLDEIRTMLYQCRAEKESGRLPV